MNNRERKLTGKNLKQQKSRILKMEDKLWDAVVKLSEELSFKGGYSVSASETIRRILENELKKRSLL